MYIGVLEYYTRKTMYDKIQLSIVRIIVEANGFISADEIAKQLHVSRRTIFNNMKNVKELCYKYNADLTSISSKGYKIDNYYEVYVFLKNKKSVELGISSSESQLYIAYLLLDDANPIRICEMQDILYCSRPTVYKYINNLKFWFNKFDIVLIVSRKGVYLQAGEKRFRHALQRWVLEVMELFENKKMQKDYSDILKMQIIIKNLFIHDFKNVIKCVEKICNILMIHISRQEMKNISILFEISLYRDKSNQIVNVSQRLISLTISFFSSNNIKKIYKSIEEILNVKIPESELIYLIISLIQIGNFSDYAILNRNSNNFIINKKLLKSIEIYLGTRLNLNDSAMQELMNDVQFIIKHEVLFQIKGENIANIENYISELQKFNATVEIAKNVFKKIVKYYDIFYREKTISNLVFSILSVIQKNKKNICAVLIHNCNIFEFKYVLSALQKFSVISLVYSTDKSENLKKYIDYNRPDLIFSTINYKNNSFPVIEITKIFSGIEFIENMKDINKIYELLNLKRIINDL